MKNAFQPSKEEIGFGLASRLISALAPATWGRTPARRLTQPMVSFLSDDGALADHSALLPIFAGHGAVASVAAISALAAGAEHPASLPACMRMPYMNAEQLKELQCAGWEVLSHTRTHRDLCGLRGGDLETELAGSLDELRGLGLQVGEALVYPFGNYNPAVLTAVSRHYRFGVAARGGINSGWLEPLQIRRVAFEASDERYYLRQVDRAVAAGGWLVFMLHPGLPQFDRIQQHGLASTLDYLRCREVSVVTVGEALRRISYGASADRTPPNPEYGREA